LINFHKICSKCSHALTTNDNNNNNSICIAP